MTLGTSNDVPEWSDEILKKMAIAAGEKAVGLHQRDPRGIYVEEDRLIEWERFGRTKCRLFGHLDELEAEPMLNVHQQEIGTAWWCPRCGAVVEKEDALTGL